jgi:threonine dehydratase
LLYCRKKNMSLDFAAIRAAHERIRSHIQRTPVLTTRRLDEASGASLFFKCENFQKVGAFKARGATNAVFLLDEATARRGVATHSSGNHAAALARAAKLRGIAAHIVMPSNSTKAKVRAVESYGGRIVFCEPNQTARETTCARVIQETGATLIHSSDDERVIAGQGTVAVEFLEDVPKLDLLLCPVGGGGLLCGSALAAKAMQRKIKVVATEPASADDTAQSFRSGRLVRLEKVNTIADGLRTNIAASNFALIQQYVDDVVTVSEEGIIEAMRAIWETMKIIVEPSAAVSYAAILEHKIDLNGQRAGVVLTGGNVDLDALPWIRKA